MDPAVDLVRAAWAQRGVALGDADLEMVGVLAAQFGPVVEALWRLDVTGLPLEGDLDPGISVPVGPHEPTGLPLGLQLLAPWREEARLLDAAAHLEQARG